MPQTCTICRSPNRDMIDRAILANEPLRYIASHYSTSTAALQRHKANDLPKALQKAKEAEEIARADDLVERLKALQTKARTVWEAAEKAGDRKTMLGAIREARGNIELLGKLTGRFDERKPQRGYPGASGLETFQVDTRPPEWLSRH